MTSGLSATEIRAKLDHPVIDADGHIVEVAPVYEEYIAKVAGPEVRDRAVAGMKGPLRLWYDLSEEERFARHLARPPFWVHPASNSYDLATAVLPALMRARMDEIGIDLGIVYPTFGLQVPRVADDEIRRAMCRALNLMHHELFAGHADRLIPAATIPMQTPGEALDEIGYACDELGYKVVMLQGIVRRPFLGQDGKPVPGNPVWVDPLGIDSLHDYDPLWQALVDRGIPANMHTGAMSVGMRASPSNYVYNHIGHFASAHEACCKALLLGGVTRRFPDLAFGFLEGGVGWATTLYGDLIAHWEKRNGDAIRSLNPKTIDSARFRELCEKYAAPGHRAALESFAENRHWFFAADLDQAPGVEDEWAGSGIRGDEDFARIFSRHFYFGCEADDRAVAGAFDTRVNPFGARLNALFSSDIGHWDVPDIAGVLAEAHELVDDGLIDETDFRDFAFANAVRLQTLNRPDFFEGTAVEDAVNALLAAEARAQAAE